MAEYDKEKILEILFDPDVSEIMTQLEDGPQNVSKLSENTSIPVDTIHERLSFLVECKMITKIESSDGIIYGADSAKLSEAIANESNFDEAIDGLTSMNSFLN